MSFEINPAFKRKLEKLSQPRSVSLPELMPPSFMRTHTNFSDLQEMFDKSEFAKARQDDVKSILESDTWSIYVRENTTFSTWTEMLNAAVAENFRKHFNG